jgi:phosphoribosylglycinamide formyltransferase-1
VLHLGVLISGRGSNLRSIVAAIEGGRLDAAIATIVSNRPGAAGLAWSEARGLPTTTIDHRTFPTRAAFDAAVVEALVAARVDLVVLAGFDRLVTTTLLRAFPKAVLNVHPALLPAFKGLHAQRQALDYGVRVTGATIHFVDEDVDHGPIIVQGAVVVLPDDTEDTLAARILEVEHRLYPLAIQLIAEDRLRVEGRRVRIAGPLPAPPPPLVWLG